MVLRAAVSVFPCCWIYLHVETKCTETTEAVQNLMSLAFENYVHVKFVFIEFVSNSVLFHSSWLSYQLSLAFTLINYLGAAAGDRRPLESWCFGQR